MFAEYELPIPEYRCQECHCDWGSEELITRRYSLSKTSKDCIIRVCPSCCGNDLVPLSNTTMNRYREHYSDGDYEYSDYQGVYA